MGTIDGTTGENEALYSLIVALSRLKFGSKGTKMIPSSFSKHLESFLKVSDLFSATFHPKL